MRKSDVWAMETTLYWYYCYVLCCMYMCSTKKDITLQKTQQKTQQKTPQKTRGIKISANGYYTGLTVKQAIWIIDD